MVSQKGSDSSRRISGASQQTSGLPQKGSGAVQEGPGRKVFAGPRVRRLRQERGLNQSEMSAALGFSVSYLNLVERNQRPLSAQFLLRLAEVYDVDLASFAGADEARAFSELTEILADPLLAGFEMSRRDCQELADMAPRAVDILSHLYRAYKNSRQSAVDLSAQVAEQGGELAPIAAPAEEVRDFLHQHHNYFPQLDEAGEALAKELELTPADTYALLVARLDEAHSVHVRHMSQHVMPDRVRYFDYHRRQLQLSETLDAPARNFQLAFQLMHLEQRELLQALSHSDSRLQSEEAKRLARLALANYAAASLLMPYGRFLKAAQETAYDLDLLSLRFGTSFEQVAHRLTTLGRPGEKGIPFFFVRVDRAGNISKRFSAGKFPFSRYGGTCPLWAVHRSFERVGDILPQLIELPDGSRFFTLSRALSARADVYGAPARHHAIGLGCEVRHADALVYSRKHPLGDGPAELVGPGCRLCERPNCVQRAHPPLARPLVVDVQQKTRSAYHFEA